MTQISIATNNADVGGGEVMLLALADALRDLVRAVSVVAPAGSEIAAVAGSRGHAVVALPARGRAGWMRALRRWDRSARPGVLWCNGLVPAVATAGAPGRIVQLHRLPDGPQRLLTPVARARATATIVPSAFMAAQIPGARYLPNWSDEVVIRPGDGSHPTQRVRVGFLGRLSPDKGVVELAEAVALVPEVELLVAGEGRFVQAADQRRVERALEAISSRARRLGWVEPAALLSDVDVLAAPSVWPEPFGLVVTEAMSAGVPVVVSDGGALPEVVGHDHPWVARAGDVVDLTRVLRLVAAASPEDRAAVGEAGRERWRSLYSPEAGHARVARLLDDLGL